VNAVGVKDHKLKHTLN